ncbi:DHA2 family efflux MFS transporter permease subunit [Henriciella sp.]|uniref:DHA2 family efflux MFS transporter permease subunit n=1 Tax=Henriciella sp. TaxID=1968823 RepID=UPI002618FAF2|nr:DHA2 family efflux MFS transporter permease subunit [Henriciella sp.]
MSISGSPRAERAPKAPLPLPDDIPPLANPAVRDRFAQFGSIYRWLLLFAMLTGSMGTLLAATTINVALPAIIGAFGLGQDQAQWMSTAFLASSTIAMLANAWAMSNHGPRFTYIFAMLMFVAGSLLGAVSSSLALLILARAMQGVAAGLIQPMSMFLIFQTFPDHQRGTAIGIFSIGVVLAPAFGPALGGVAVDLASWRLVFVATVPLAIVALGAAYFLMPEADPEQQAERRPLDWVGLGLLTIGIVSLLSGFAGGNRDGWDSDLSLIKFTLGAVVLVGFILWELRHPHPALNPAIFKYRQFWSAGMIIAATGIAIYGSTYLIPLFVQLVQGYSPTAAGVMMIPAGLAMVIGFPIAGNLTDKVDARLLLGFGIICFTLSAWFLSHISMLTPYWPLVWMIVLSRVGISFCMPPANTTAVRAAPPHLLAAATGGASFLMQVGGAFGVNLLAILLQRRLIFHGDHLAAGLNEANPQLAYEHFQHAQQYEVAGMPPMPAFQTAFGEFGKQISAEASVFAFRDCFLVIAIWFMLVMFILTLMPRPNLQARPAPPAVRPAETSGTA